jgi:hypothetical protein
MRNCHPIRSIFQQVALSLLLFVALSVPKGSRRVRHWFFTPMGGWN